MKQENFAVEAQSSIDRIQFKQKSTFVPKKNKQVLELTLDHWKKKRMNLNPIPDDCVSENQCHMMRKKLQNLNFPGTSSHRGRLSQSLTPQAKSAKGGKKKKRFDDTARSELSVVSSSKSVATARSLMKTKNRKSVYSITSQLTSRKSPGGTNKIINDYQLHEVLGIGSFGKVRRCVDMRTQEEYAVKIIPRKQFKGNNVIQQQQHVAQKLAANEEQKEEAKEPAPRNQSGIT